MYRQDHKPLLSLEMFQYNQVESNKEPPFSLLAHLELNKVMVFMGMVKANQILYSLEPKITDHQLELDLTIMHQIMEIIQLIQIHM